MQTHILATPNLDRPITASSVNQPLSTPTHDVDTGRVTAETELELHVGSVPDPNRPVFRTTRQPGRLCRVGREMRRLPCERSDPLRVTFQSITKWFACLRVPQPDVTVVSTSGENSLQG